MKPAKSFVLSNLTVLYGDTQSHQENAQLSDTPILKIVTPYLQDQNLTISNVCLR